MDRIIPTTEDTTEIDTNRFDRNIRVFGQKGQQRLAAAHVAVAGVGGLGSLMAEQLARYGTGTLTIIDPDNVEKSNLPRLFGAYQADVGQPKVTVVQEHLEQIDPGITVTAINKRCEHAVDSLNQADLIVAGLDQISARTWLNQFAVNNDTPYIDAGVRITTTDADDSPQIDGMQGVIQRIVPGDTACFDCLDRGNPEQAWLEQLNEDEQQEAAEAGYIEETDLSPAPAVVPLNGIVASKAVQLAARHITGYATPAHYLTFDGVDNTLTAAQTRPNDECPTCGEHSLDNLDLDTTQPTEPDR